MKAITIQILTVNNIEDAYECARKYHAEMMKKYSYELCKALYADDVSNLRKWQSQMSLAEQCGTTVMEFGGHKNYTAAIIRNLQCAIDFLSDPPQIARKEIRWDEMPDLLTDEQLSDYFGWALSTIQSKRSRGELPYVSGMSLTPKKQLRDMIERQLVDVNANRGSADDVKNKVNSFKRK